MPKIAEKSYNGHMKIGIDIRTASAPSTGKGQYTFHIVKELLKLDRKNEYLLYTNAISGGIADMLNSASNAPHIKIINKSAFAWHFAVIKDFIALKGNLFFAPTSCVIPAFLSKKIKSVITVHDLIAFLSPHLHQTKATVIEHIFLKKALRKAAHILVPSQNTKNDLIKIMRAPKISVIPLAADEMFFEEPKNIESIKEKYNLHGDFILTVSGLEPRKNIARLIDAVSKIAADDKNKDSNIKLVIVGGKGWKSRKLLRKINEASAKSGFVAKNASKNFVLHIENCDSKDLPAFYRLAKIFVFPSLYEGFGLPPLEAMASGCPVICSNAASLPEVCGDAALYINPENTDELKSSIEKMLNSQELRENFIELGKKRAKLFSWEKTAKKTLEIFDNIASITL